jgi:hypothetical protein
VTGKDVHDHDDGDEREMLFQTSAENNVSLRSTCTACVINNASRQTVTTFTSGLIRIDPLTRATAFSQIDFPSTHTHTHTHSHSHSHSTGSKFTKMDHKFDFSPLLSLELGKWNYRTVRHKELVNDNIMIPS